MAGGSQARCNTASVSFRVIELGLSPSAAVQSGGRLGAGGQRCQQATELTGLGPLREAPPQPGQQCQRKAPIMLSSPAMLVLAIPVVQSSVCAD